MEILATCADISLKIWKSGIGISIFEHYHRVAWEKIDLSTPALANLLIETIPLGFHLRYIVVSGST
jgi:hypothetical protein